jgi:hypothetical protein
LVTSNYIIARPVYYEEDELVCILSEHQPTVGLDWGYL